jgi:DNA-binding transcriptional MerR regulator
MRATRRDQAAIPAMSEKSPDAFRTISEVSEDLDIPAHVLRFWESKFTQVHPIKRGGGRRYYRPEDVNLIRGIRDLLYKDGMTIKGVQKVLRDQGVKKVAAGAAVPAAAVPVAVAPVAQEMPSPLPAGQTTLFPESPDPEPLRLELPLQPLPKPAPAARPAPEVNRAAELSEIIRELELLRDRMRS